MREHRLLLFPSPAAYFELILSFLDTGGYDLRGKAKHGERSTTWPVGEGSPGRRTRRPPSRIKHRLFPDEGLGETKYL